LRSRSGSVSVAIHAIGRNPEVNRKVPNIRDTPGIYTRCAWFSVVLSLGVGGIFFPTPFGAVSVQKICVPPPPTMPPEFRILHRSKFSLYGAFRSRTACGQSADIYRAISGCFSPFSRYSISPSSTNGNRFPEAEPRSGRIPPPYPLRKIRRESNKRNALWCSSLLPRAVFTRAPIWGANGQVLQDLPAPHRTFEGGSLPGRIFPAPEWFALLPVQLSPFAGSSYSLEA
jgi:hypothetical protein